jgi:signal transduction histidine kinase/tetratricopeptide (TPR) repeat protein
MISKKTNSFLRINYLYIVLCFSLTCYSQSDELKTYSDSLSIAKTKQSKIRILEKIIELNIQQKYKNDIQNYIDTLSSLYLSLSDSSNYYKTRYYSKAMYHSNFPLEVPLALRNYSEYVDYLKTKNKETENGYLYVDIGNLYTSIGLNESAIKQYKVAEKIFHIQKLNNGLTTVYNNLAICLVRLKKSDEAIYYSEKALKLCYSSNQDSFYIAYSNHNLARVYSKLGDYEKAKLYLYKAYRLFSAKEFETYLGKPQLIESYHSNMLMLAECSMELKQYDSCYKYLNITRALQKKEGLFHNAIYCDNVEARFFFRQKQFAEAAKKWESIISNSHINGINTNIKSVIAKSLMSVYDSLKNNDKSNYYARMHYQIRDSIDKAVYNDNLIILNSLIVEQENELEIQEQKQLLKEKTYDLNLKKIESNVLWVFLGFVILMLALAFVIIKMISRKNSEINEISNEIKLLNEHNEFLLSVIGHDLKNPFSSLISSLNTAYKQPDLSQKNRLIQIGKQASEDLYILSEQLIQWISIEKINSEKTPEDVDVTELINEHLMSLTKLSVLNDNEIDLTLNARWLQTNKLAFAIVIRNLLLNTIKYCNTKESIELKTYYENRKFNLTIQNDFINLEDAFFSEFNSTENNSLNKNSKGLGLIIIKRICASINCQVKLTKLPNNILVFKLTFEKEEREYKNEHDSSLNEKTVYTFSKDEVETLKPALKQLYQIPIFETSQLIDVINNIQGINSANFEKWKHDLLDSVYKIDKNRFEYLTNESYFK